MAYNKIVFIMDVTGSMGSFVPALIPSVLQSTVISQIINKGPVEIGIVTYSDYDVLNSNAYNVIETIYPTTNIDSIKKFLNEHSNVYGGGGIPEAFKTGMIEVLKMCDENTIVLHYTDAYPHTDLNLDTQGRIEKNMIESQYWVWDSLVDLFKNTHAKFITFHTRHLMDSTQCFVDLGEYLVVRNKTSDIVESTINKLMEFMPFNKQIIGEWFNTCDSYKNKCLCMFRDYILNKDCIDALNTNELFIYVWRMLNKFYKKDKLFELLDSMSNLTSGRTWLSEMIQESYRDVDAVLEIINSASSLYPAFYYTGDQKNIKDVMNMARLGDLESFSDILQNNKIVESGTVGSSIPLSLSPDRFLTVLSHLLCSGVMFNSKRSKWLLSALIVSKCSDDNPLFSIADSYLQKMTGVNIIDLSTNVDGTYKEPLNLSPFLSSLILNMPSCYVSKSVVKFYRSMRNSMDVSSVLHANIDITRSKILRGHAIEGNTKTCDKCGQERHESLIPDKICGLCIQYDKHSIKREPTPGNSVSYMYGCSECGVNYQIVNQELLYGNPKCYHCKENVKNGSRSRTCKICFNKFKTYDKKIDCDWTCYSCKKGDILIEDMNVPVSDIVSHNSTVLSKTLPPNIKCCKFSEKMRVLDGIEWCVPDSITFGNTTNVLTAPSEVIGRIRKLQSEVDQCGICFDDFSHDKLVPICGNDGCRTRSCRSCLTKLYGSNKAGCIFNADLCPYCRQTPNLRTIRSVNKDLFKMLNVSDVLSLDSKMYHFWCRDCNKVKPYIQRECAMATPELHDQVCVDCCNPDVCMDDHLKCPDCGILVDHVDGCNHITCLCGCHFCSICSGTWPDGSSIYEHYDNGDCPMYGTDGQFNY